MASADVAQNRFREHSPGSLYELCIAYWLTIFKVLGCGHIRCQKYIRQLDSEVLHYVNP